MAVIQMLNEQVHDVQETGEELASILRRNSEPVVKLRGKDDTGTFDLWVNPDAISSIVG